MSRRKRVETKQIKAAHWDNNEVVIIRSRTGPDNTWIQDRNMNMVPGEMSMHLLTGTTQDLTLLRCIETWTFTDAENKPLPWPPLSMREADNAAIYQIRGKSLEEVFEEDRAFIFMEINELSKPMAEEEKKASSMSALLGSQVNHHESQSTSLTIS